MIGMAMRLGQRMGILSNAVTRKQTCNVAEIQPVCCVIGIIVFFNAPGLRVIFEEVRTPAAGEKFLG